MDFLGSKIVLYLRFSSIVMLNYIIILIYFTSTSKFIFTYSLRPYLLNLSKQYPYKLFVTSYFYTITFQEECIILYVQA